MEMINVLNRLTELSKENDSPDVKQAMENTKRIVGDRNAVVVEEHIVEGMNEVITKKTSAGEIISDFQKSKNKKFKGKSKAERQKMALGAYYGMHPEKSRKAKMGEAKLMKTEVKEDITDYFTSDDRALNKAEKAINDLKGDVVMSQISIWDNASKVLANATEIKNKAIKNNPENKERVERLYGKFMSRFENSNYNPNILQKALENFYKTLDQENINANKMGETKLTPKQMKIAGAADPKNKITGADFAALRKGKTVENSLAENTELAAMKKLAGLNECGAMMGSMAPHTPANISINASAASGTEVASMLRDLMKLAGGESDKPEIAVVSSEPMDTMDSMDSMEGMVDEEAADGHFADATTEPAGPAGAVYDENPVVSMTGRQVQTPNGNARQNDNPLEESLWNKFQAEKKSSLVQEAEYHGKNVPLNKKLPGDVKKSKVYVKKPNGKVVKVNFGDPNMRIKKSNPKRRKSFRARHHCKNPGPKWKARYWSCKSW